MFHGERAATRRHETAVRLALGAGPGRVFRLHAAEGLLLATLDGLAGIWIAQVALAVWLPVRRATRVNPAEALRAD